MKGGVDLINAVFTGSHAELLAEGHPDGRSHLGDDPFSGIEQGVPDLSLGLFDGDGACGTDCCTLAAVDAFRFRKLPVKGWGYDHIGATVDEVDGSHMLDLVAHADAVAAEDALVHIPDNGGRGVIDLIIGPVVLKTDIVKAEPAGQGLELAFLVLFTDGAVPAVGGQQKLQDHFPVVVQLGRIGADHHFILGRCGAGGDDISLVVLHHAHAAGAVNGKIRIVAEGGDVDPDVPDHLKDIFFVCELCAESVYDHIFSHVSPLLILLLLRRSCSRPGMRGT